VVWVVSEGGKKDNAKGKTGVSERWINDDGGRLVMSLFFVFIFVTYYFGYIIILTIFLINKSGLMC
jgi:hypothetical protein